MLRAFLRRFIAKHRALLIHELSHLNGFMALLMKQRNTGVSWTTEERSRLKAYLAGLFIRIPVLAIFILPGGSLLIPILAEILDRRSVARNTGAYAPEPACGRPSAAEDR